MDNNAGVVKADVLLCERPSIQLQPSKASTVFINHASPIEKLDRQGLGLGLNPIRKIHAITRSRKPSKPSALDKHRRHVALLQRANREREAAGQLQLAQDAASKDSLLHFSAQLRSAILSGDDVAGIWAPAARADTLRLQQEADASTVQDLRASLPKVLDVDTWRRSSSVPANLHHTQGQGSSESLQEEEEKQQLAHELDAFVDQALQEAAARAASGAGTSASAVNSAAGASTAAEQQQEVANSSGAQAAKEHARPGTACSTRSVKASKRQAKPAWALTEQEAADQSTVEEADLLSFAEDLDWNEFTDQLSDSELQGAFQALQEADAGNAKDSKEWRRCFVRAMNHVAMKNVAAATQGGKAAKHAGSEAGDNASEGGQSTYSRGTGASRQHAEGAAARRAALLQRLGDAAGSKWDASTRVGDADDVGAGADVATKAHEAAVFLRANPDMRSVHSAASVRSLLVRSEVGMDVAGNGALVSVT